MHICIILYVHIFIYIYTYIYVHIYTYILGGKGTVQDLC